MEYKDIRDILIEPIKKVFNQQSPELNDEQLEPFIKEAIVRIQHQTSYVEWRNTIKFCNSCGKERKDVAYRILIDEKGNETETKWCWSCFYNAMSEHIPVGKTYKWFGFSINNVMSDNTEVNDCPICKSSGSKVPVVTAIIEESIHHPWGEQGEAELRLILHHGNHTSEWKESRNISG